MGKDAAYRPPILPLVPYDGCLVLTVCVDDEIALLPLLKKKVLAISRSYSGVEEVNKEHVEEALSFLFLQPQTIMLIVWKCVMPQNIIDYACEKELTVVYGGEDQDELQITKLAMDTFSKRNKLLKPGWVTWSKIPNHNCELTVWHKLTAKAVTKAAEDGCTHVVSLLGHKEKPELTQQACERNNVAWIWVNIQGAKEETLIAHKEDITAAIQTVLPLLEGINNRILIHCSAGVHRTGTFAYSLFRSAGFSVEDARELLYKIRPVTARQVGENRLQLAEDHFNLKRNAADLPNKEQ